MSLTSRRPRRGSTRPRSVAVGSAVAGLVAATFAAAPAQSAAQPSCTPYTEQVTEGMQVHGLTVSRGTTPDQFTGEVLGVLDDGIAPGLDMIMVELRGSEITDADGNVDKGVWSGMSGSPVYTEDGRLLGAVAYGLSWSPSDVAGVTPAEEMLKLIKGSSSNAAREKAISATRVSVPKRIGDRLVAKGDMTSAQANSGFKRLPMPFSVSGLSSRHLQKVAKRFDVKRPMVAGSSTTAEAAASPIIPGGNLGATLSYGDVTWGGIGTTTAVCGGEVIGFGHAMMWAGRSTYSMHGADAIYIQKDTVFGSYKVANLDAPVGIVNSDRLAGIHGVQGRFPNQTDVTSHVTATNGNSRDGKTVITWRSYTDLLSVIHLLSNADRVLDEIGKGSARLRWHVEGTRADGSSWEYTRTDRFASEWDITWESIWEPYSQLRKIQDNKFERVRITDVHFNGSYDPKFHAWKIAKFEVYLNGRWVTITSHRPAKTVHAGSDLPVRVTLKPSSGIGGAKVVRLDVTVPKGTAGRRGVLYVGDGRGGGSKASSFDELLVQLANAPRNDVLTATVRAGSGESGGSDTDGQNVGDVVSGERHVHLNIR